MRRGNVTGYSEETIQVHADSVIIAVSQGPKDKLVNTTKGFEGHGQRTAGDGR